MNVILLYLLHESQLLYFVGLELRGRPTVMQQHVTGMSDTKSPGATATRKRNLRLVNEEIHTALSLEFVRMPVPRVTGKAEIRLWC